MPKLSAHVKKLLKNEWNFKKIVLATLSIFFCVIFLDALLNGGRFIWQNRAAGFLYPMHGNGQIDCLGGTNSDCPITARFQIPPVKIASIGVCPGGKNSYLIPVDFCFNETPRRGYNRNGRLTVEAVVNGSRQVVASSVYSVQDPSYYICGRSNSRYINLNLRGCLLLDSCPLLSVNMRFNRDSVLPDATNLKIIDSESLPGAYCPKPTLTQTLGPTSTPTVNVPIIACNEEVEYVGSTGTFNYIVNLGSELGKVELIYNPFSVPDRIKVEFDGAEVIDTGFESGEYDNLEKRESWNKKLDLIGKPQLAGFSGLEPEKELFVKNSQTTNAKVIVDAPFDPTLWIFKLSCPRSQSGSRSTATPTPKHDSCEGIEYYTSSSNCEENCFVDNNNRLIPSPFQHNNMPPGWRRGKCVPPNMVNPGSQNENMWKCCAGTPKCGAECEERYCDPFTHICSIDCHGTLSCVGGKCVDMTNCSDTNSCFCAEPTPEPTTDLPWPPIYP